MDKIITLRKNEDKRINNGHLWVFSNEIQEISGEPQSGDIVALQDHAGKFLGIGFYNQHSLISVRLLSRHEEEINFEFFHKRIESALRLRKQIYPDFDTFRLIHGESDYLPGLIVDKYNDFLSIQTFSFGMDKHLMIICDVLESIFNLKGIIERNETPIRKLEGLEQRKGILRGSIDSVVISEYDIKYQIDLLEGQKTGFFLDQRENRKAFRRYTKSANVLDCFCNDGAFALNSTYAGATNVIGIDISESAIQRAVNNAELNKLDKQTKFIVVNAFEFLEEMVNRKEQFVVVNLDPPSFAKSKKTVRKAKRGYKEIHTNAMKVLKPGGILSTASCSYNITEETFLSIINDCAHDLGREIILLEWYGAAPDHPTLPSMPETKYLKFGIFQIL